MPRRPRIHLTRRAVVAGVVALVAIGGGTYTLASRHTAAVQYRTGTVTKGTVTQTLSLSGNLSPVSATDVNFESSGAVTSVRAAVGDKVTAGQVLATIDPTTLRAALIESQASLTQAEAKLTQDEGDSGSTSLSQEQSQVSSAQVSLNNARTAYNDTVKVNAQKLSADSQAISAQQQLVNADSGAVTTDENKRTSDEDTEDSDCGNPPPPESSATGQCLTDEKQVDTDNQTVANAQQTLAKDQQALQQDQAAYNAQRVGSQQGDDQAAGQVSSAQEQYNSAVASLQSAETSQNSDTSVEVDNAQILTAEVDEQTAQKAYNNATLRAPVGGTITAVNVATGDSVSGSSGSGSSSGGSSGSGSSASSSSSSSSADFIIETPGAFAVTGTVSDSEVSEVAVGQRAEITPASSTEALDGTVTSVAQAATVSSGVATFAVTVTITGNNPSLREGMSASVSVVINQVVDVLTVPTAAVHTTGTGATVQVMQNGSPQSVAVTVGASDASRTEITSGLSLNETIVLATVSSTIPTTSSSSGASIFGTGGGGGSTRRGGFTGGGGG